MREELFLYGATVLIMYFWICPIYSYSWQKGACLQTINLYFLVIKSQGMIYHICFITGVLWLVCLLHVKALCSHSCTGIFPEILVGLGVHWKSIPAPIHTWLHAGNVLEHFWDRLHLFKKKKAYDGLKVTYFKPCLDLELICQWERKAWSARVALGRKSQNHTACVEYFNKFLPSTLATSWWHSSLTDYKPKDCSACKGPDSISGVFFHTNWGIMIVHDLSSCCDWAFFPAL